jgi:hypothetical protein
MMSERYTIPVPPARSADAPAARLTQPTLGCDHASNPGLKRLESEPDVGDSSDWRDGNLQQQLRNEGLKIRKSIGSRLQHDDCDCDRGKVLLKRQISVYGKEYVKPFRNEAQEFSVLDG